MAYATIYHLLEAAAFQKMINVIGETSSLAFEEVDNP